MQRIAFNENNRRQSQEGEAFRANINKKLNKALIKVLVLELQKSLFKASSFQALSELTLLGWHSVTFHFFSCMFGFHIDETNSSDALFSMEYQICSQN